MTRRTFLIAFLAGWISLFSLFAGCKKEMTIPEKKPDEVDDDDDDDNDDNDDDDRDLVTGVSIPGIIRVEAGDTLTITGTGFLQGDTIRLTLALDGQQTYLCPVTAVTVNSAAFTVPDMISGRYNFHLVRGEETLWLGASNLTVTGDVYLSGTVADTQGKPIQGVVISDGFSCVQTDAQGKWKIKRRDDVKFVFYSVPETHEVNVASEGVNAAMFYTPVTLASQVYDFTLKKLAQPETDFTLLAIGDPQVASAADIARFTGETMSDLKTLVNASDKPCYGLVMGDMVADKPELFTLMKTTTGSSKMVYFTTIGNHDKTGGSATAPRNADLYCAVYGPLDYSFNRGNIHFVCLDNVIYSNSSTYAGGFEDRQIEWLKQDLSFVPKTKMVIVYYHIPIRNSSSVKNRTALLNALKDFDKVHLMCGHTHYTENFMITSPKSVYEHIHSAACGSWWKSVINGDGTPNGYAVYDVEGATLKNWYYKSVRYNRDFQIRLHWGDTQFGGAYGSFSYGQGHSIIANVFNADDNWTIAAYEDGQLAGYPVRITETTKDAWAMGYHIGVLNRNPDNYDPPNRHLYKYTIKNTSATTIEIRATDRFGRVYSQTEIIDDLKTAGSYSS
ncbi:MAG: calcineurin-like phosphoesterase family protein [Bacteroidales bacterium]|jgi:hypothetical protein|nr:calcineurin-like phosphoesterase family protein [Bacteroidales bacterium]